MASLEGQAEGRDGGAEALRRGVELRERGDLDGAIQAFREADALGSAEGTVNLGVVLEAAGDPHGAEEAWRRAVVSGSAYGSLNLAELLEKRGEYDEAEAYYRRALEGGVPQAQAGLDRLASPQPQRRTLTLTDPLTSGEDVRDLQTWLGELGHRVDVDGIYGPLTSRAVADFQSATGLTADGTVGPATWDALAVTPSVRQVVQSLTGEVTASALAAALLSLHPEYGGGAAAKLQLDQTAGERATATEWLDRVRRSADVRLAPRLHGRLVIAGLSRLDDELAAQLAAAGFPAALEREIREPLAAVFGDAQAAAEEFDFVASATSDLPASEDVLGFKPLVNALQTLLDDQRTVLPLAIAVTAPWGAGKSSVMYQLRAALTHPPAGRPAYRTWKTVQFDAWKYERSERLWAALGKAIYEQPQAGMRLAERVRFRFALERTRLGGWKLFTMTVWPLLAAAVAVFAAVSADLTAGGTVAVLATSGAAISAAATRYSTLASDPFKRAIDRHAKRPDYETQLGFTSEADHDIQSLTRVLAPDDTHGLAVFVDDLDRCSSGNVVEVVEAMNQIFNAAQDRRCVFILGLDRDVVVSNIEVAYGATVAQLKETGNPLGDRFGLEFLAKLVQLSVAIPQPSPDALEKLLGEITGNPVPEQELSEPAVEQVQAAIQQEGAATLADVGTATATPGTDRPHADAVAAEAVRRERAQLIRDSREVIDAEFAALAHLDANPRQVKRFHNAFRLQLYVANEDSNVDFDFTGDQLVALARWVALRLRWPAFGDRISRSPALLRALEDGWDAPTVKKLPADVRKRLKPEYDKWAANDALCALLTEENPARKISSLPLRSFLRVA